VMTYSEQISIQLEHGREAPWQLATQRLRGLPEHNY
jgi:hypothetical protein